MNSHIEITRLHEAAEQKFWLDSQEWKHIEECRKCLDELSEAVRIRRKANEATRRLRPTLSGRVA